MTTIKDATKLAIGKSVWVKTPSGVHRATIYSLNPSRTLLKVAIDGLDGEFVIKPTDIARAPRKDRPIKSMEAGKLNKHTWNFIVKNGKAVKPPVEAYPAPHAPQLLFDARWADHTGYAILTMAVRVPQCPKCGRLVSGWESWTNGLHYVGDLTPVEAGNIDGKTQRLMCIDCTKSVAEYECYLCHETKTLEDMEVHRYPYYLCKACFETTSAKAWDEAEDEIIEKRFDGDDDY